MTLPVVALRDMTILPGMMVHFDVSRDKSMAAVQRAMVLDQKVFIVMQKDIGIEEPGQDDLYEIGVIARIKQIVKLHKNIVRVMVEGLRRAELVQLDSTAEFLEGSVEELSLERQEPADPLMEEAMCRLLKDQIIEYGNENPGVSKESLSPLLEIDQIDELIDMTAANIPFSTDNQQRILDTILLSDRFDFFTGLMANEIRISVIKKEFQHRVKARIDKNQKEYILREQLREIREELGEDNVSEADRFEELANALKTSETIKDKLFKEIQRFKSIPPGSQESTVSRTYIETLLELPWEKASIDNKNLKKAARILDEDHYGLEKVKERILEFLAVRTLTGKGDSPIICLVGPPGTGKTSIARSLARALNKEYVRMSLGGVRDEAEIRGHRKTYVGAMPGRIASAMKQAGVNNPLLLLDEIDKVGNDYKGDPSSALLEVLDSEQNHKFRDHYLEVPLDLSNVLFIATANTTQTIPQPLIDRMEVIEISSYTENEKYHIAKDYLLDKQIKKNGLSGTQLKLSRKAIEKIIQGYTKEAGVRNLERKIADICRKAAREILEDKKESVKVGVGDLERYLGREKVMFDQIGDKAEVGIARGLAWTKVGGTTLQIEVNLMPGKGKMKLTGQMGDVMKESAAAALSYIRSMSSVYAISEDFFDMHDIHIHIPEGAVPKDGPSAGITMATAMLSAVTGKKVRADVAMTGEITLRGRVLMIGGLKEKLLAAKKAGVKTVIVPEKNRPDVEELSEEITKGLHIVFTDTMKDVLKEAFADIQRKEYI